MDLTALLFNVAERQNFHTQWLIALTAVLVGVLIGFLVRK